MSRRGMKAYRAGFTHLNEAMPSFELISNLLCPYTLRAAIQLAEKGLPFERTYIDLAARPAWFARLSPLGKVPLLRVGNDEALFETAVICEYIEDVAQDRPMWATDPLDRARERAWAEYASAIIADVFGFYMAPDTVTFDRKRADLAARFQRLERQLDFDRSLPGPYFAGQRFGLVDAAFAPIFRLFETFDSIGDFGIFADLIAVPAYRTALAERASVRDAAVANYGQVFRQYLLARGSHLSRVLSGLEPLRTVDPGDGVSHIPA